MAARATADKMSEMVDVSKTESVYENLCWNVITRLTGTRGIAG